MASNLTRGFALTRHRIIRTAGMAIACQQKCQRSGFTREQTSHRESTGAANLVGDVAGGQRGVAGDHDNRVTRAEQGRYRLRGPQLERGGHHKKTCKCTCPCVYMSLCVRARACVYICVCLFVCIRACFELLATLGTLRTIVLGCPPVHPQLTDSTQGCSLIVTDSKSATSRLNSKSTTLYGSHH